jgi:hypothetical protein
MALEQRLISTDFPYVPLILTVRGVRAELRALLDTGFDGDVAAPLAFFPPDARPDGDLPWTLADGSVQTTPAFWGIAEVGEFAVFPVTVIALGGEFIVGRGVSDRFAVTLDHGQRLIIEP